jgi:hypothetical protein
MRCGARGWQDDGVTLRAMFVMAAFMSDPLHQPEASVSYRVWDTV